MTTVSSARLKRPACTHFSHISVGKFCYFRAGSFFYYRSRLQVGWSKMLSNFRQLSGCGGPGDAVSAAAAVSVQDVFLTLPCWDRPHRWPSHANVSMHV